MALLGSLKERLLDKTSSLPSQVSVRHIIAISICSVVGTGVFISTLSTSLRRAGPAGVLIAYAVTSSIVYCTAVSNGEMMAHLPSVGGPVGLADVFVDPALGFAMGWNAWYHWTIIIPTQLAAAGRLVNAYISTDPTPRSMSLYNGSIAFFLLLAVCLNFMPAKRFGQIHAVFALLKMLTLAGVVLIALIIDWSPVLRCNAFPDSIGCTGRISGFTCSSELLESSSITVRLLGKYWRCPGPWVQPFGTKGVWGSILGIFTVLIQAAFSFFGTEIAGVPGKEIEEPAKNIQRAIRRVWIRVTIFYTLAVIAAGLVVRSDNPSLKLTPAVAGSPWIIALKTGYSTKTPQYVLSAFFILSAFSAASADIYVSSRYLFFLARRGHAPIIFGSLLKGRPKVISPFKTNDMREQINTPFPISAGVFSEPSNYTSRPLHLHSREPSATSSPLSPLSSSSPLNESGIAHAQGHHRQLSYTLSIAPQLQSSGQSSSGGTPVPRNTQTASRPRTAESTQPTRKPLLVIPQVAHPSASAPPSLHSPVSPQGPRTLKRTKALGSAPPPDLVVPWVGVLAAAAISLLVFMAPAGQTHRSVNDAFTFLTQMTNCAALVAWVCILITYLRFYDGTRYQETKDPAFRTKHADTLYNNRPWGQPWLARYALGWCIAILLGQGWSSFTSPGVKRIAELDGDPPIIDNPDIGDFDLAFIVAYLPLALFLLLAFGYKLVYQTRFVTLENMNFASERRRPKAVTTSRLPPTTVLGRIYETLL